MKKLFLILSTITLLVSITSCEKEIRNIGPTPPVVEPTPQTGQVNPVNINEKGFEFLEKMQGHWIGTNRVIADDFDWFAFDFRAIAPSIVHGIFEGGSMGNLFNTFYVSDFKGTRTIMARNGGVLNGIYRTSYFVMDSVRYDEDGSFYRIVDAEGGTNTMWMELRFTNDSLYFNAYTSRLGLTFPPSRHMTFKAKRENPDLAENAANAVGFPQNISAWDFSDGFIQEYLNAEAGAKSATFLAYDETGTKDVFALAAESGDPWIINQHPYLAYLNVTFDRHPAIENKTLWLNLSKEPLTDANGYFNSIDAMNSILLFPEIIGSQSEFLITYLHPGDYYINVTADLNDDGTISPGDLTHPLQQITINPEEYHEINISNITVEN
jgi:hypothetical protein